MNGAQFLLIFALALLTVVAGWCAFAPAGMRERLAKRALAAVKKGAAPKKRDIPTLRLNPNATRLDILTGRILPNPEHWRRLLERSGTGWSLGKFGTVAAIVGIVTVIVAMLLRVPTVFAWGVGGLAGWYLPRLYIYWMIKRRSKKFLALFPDAIGLMVRGVRSGLPVTETIINVGREMKGVVGYEFRKVSDQIQLGQPLDEVLWQAAGRIDLAEFTFMCISFSIQRETGGNLAETLDNLEQLLRNRKQMQLKIRAYSSEARASSMIIGSLPFIMLALLSVVNWPYISTLFYSHGGHMLLAAAAGCLILGIAVLTKLASFEI
ncbi:MAG TPA: type II secretion system F family protein [Stellaceae bacterium]|nr:type II secretion system F family protein [Stellaceae bacterium]